MASTLTQAKGSQPHGAAAGHSLDNAIIARHRSTWRRKPVLAHVYAVWFDRLLSELPHDARVLEVGAGPGFFSQYARRMRPDLTWIASDYLCVSGNHLVADALALPIRTASLDAIVGFDVVHHLSRPASFFAEAARALRPAGTVLLVEPWLSLLSYPLYRLFHHETCRLAIDPWRPFVAHASHSKETFEGDSAVAWKMIRVASRATWQELGFAQPRVQILNGLAYLASLGFYGPSLVPRASSAGALIRLDRWLQPLAAWIGLRALLSWRRLP